MSLVEPLIKLWWHIVAWCSLGPRSLRFEDRGAENRRVRRADREPVDIVEISPEAVFRYAALQFDPHHISYEEAESLAQLLRDGGAIDRGAQEAFLRAIATVRHTKMTAADMNSPDNLITAFDKIVTRPDRPWRGNPDIGIALAILRTIVSCRLGLPPPA